jgi:serine/threonine-protein kinase
MNRARWKEVDDHFREALEFADAQRVSFVREVLVRDPELGLAVKDLLEYAAEAEAVLGENAAVFSSPLLAALSDDEWDTLHPGALVGGYRILREATRDRSGAVYLGEPVVRSVRPVAITVLARRADTSEILARLRHDGTRLAGLDHPCIARFHEGGALPDGRAYFVAEWIEGPTLAASCDERRLDVESRLLLFQQACSAVQFAHQQLVVHGTLSLSAIRVTVRGTPKVQSFGLAGVLGRTAPSPTAADVQALGACLYELLAGHGPVADAPDTGEPVRMSVVARAGGGGVSAARGMTPGRLSSVLRGDLDAMVSRAMDTDPARRHESAGALAADIERFLRGRPRRNRVRMGMVALAAVALLAITRAPVLRRHGAEPSVTTATPAPLAVASLPGAADTARELVPPFDTVTIANLAAQDGALDVVHDTPAAVRDSTPAAAIVVVRRAPVIKASAVRAPDIDSANALSRQAGVLRRAGKGADAERALREALAIRATLNSGENLQVAADEWELGDLLRVTQRYAEAEALLHNSLRTRQRLARSDGAEVGQSLAGLALLQCEQGRTSESDSLFAQAASIYRRLPASADGLSMPETHHAQCR